VYEHVYRPDSGARRPPARPVDERHVRGNGVSFAPSSSAAAAPPAAPPAAPALPQENPHSHSAKETLQLVMAEREKHDAQLKGAVAAAQNDMLAEVGQLRRSVSMAGRFKADVEAGGLLRTSTRPTLHLSPLLRSSV